MKTTTLLLPWLCLLVLPGPADARRERLDFHHTSIDLPGAPSTVVSADLDGDGRRDLVVVVAYTEWDQLAVEEMAEMDEIDGLVEVLTIVPALADRRELRVFLATGTGDFEAVQHVLPLEKDVLAVEPGFTEVPVVAVTDAGLSALRLGPDLRLSWEPLVEERPALAGTGQFLPRLGVTHDLDGDSRGDLFFPGEAGGVVYLARNGTYAGPPSARLALPTDRRVAGRSARRFYPLPEVRAVDGIEGSDLVFRDDDEQYFVLRNLGEGRFSEAVGPLGGGGEEPCDDPETCPEPVGFAYFGDLDGDGRAEWVSQESLESEDAGVRQEIAEAKRPPFRYRLYRSGPDLLPAAEPYATFDALGYTFPDGNPDDDGDGISIPGGFQDLDGDGLQDLLSLTLDFSIFQAVRILATRTISIGLDFHVYCQGDDGNFRAVEGLDLSGKFKIDLDNIQMRRLSLFDGDFDGDGRADFVQLGRGKTVSIHRGREGCRYPAEPDLELRLADEPKNLALVDIEDFDADGLSDLLIVQPNKVVEPGVTPPVRLDLYLSASAGETR